MKIRPMGVELFHADGRTDKHHEKNFATAPKNKILNINLTKIQM